MAGDINKCSLSNTVPQFCQYVNKPTRGDKILDHFYCNVSNAYHCQIIAPLGKSDHYSIQMIPIYKRKLNRIKAISKTYSLLSTDGLTKLNNMFLATNWENLLEIPENDIHIQTEIFSDYVKFCQDICSENKSVKIYSNSKPWYTREVREACKKMKMSFGHSDFLIHKIDYRKAIRHAKHEFKIKLEGNFTEKNPRILWKNMKEIMHLNTKSNDSLFKEKDAAEKLNKFFSRFETSENTRNVNNFELQTDSPNTTGPHSLCSSLDVFKTLRKINVKKARGPDQIYGKTLKSCAESLTPALCHLFNLSLNTGIVPKLWKSSTIIPLPKKKNPSRVEDFRPVALTCLVSKCLEKLILKLLLTQISDKLDPYQFAYKTKSSTFDALSTFTNTICQHLNQNSSH